MIQKMYTTLSHIIMHFQLCKRKKKRKEKKNIYIYIYIYIKNIYIYIYNIFFFYLIYLINKIINTEKAKIN